MSSLLAKDLVIYVKTTGTCNLNCAHCFTSGNQGKNITFHPEKTFDFISEIHQKNPLNSLRVIFHGGEPMLAPVKDLLYFSDLTSQLFPQVEFSIQTNLVYKLSKDKKDFFSSVISKNGMGTSWDPDIRFGSIHKKYEAQNLKLWENNVRELVQEGHKLTLMVCLSKKVISDYEPRDIINYAISLGFQYILFERLTNDGHATENTEIFPQNSDVDEWIFKMYRQTLDEKLYLKIGNMFLEEIATSYLKGLHTANRCRGCELKLITINADGTLAGCPNSATQQSWSSLDLGVDAFIESKMRVDAVCKEKMRNPLCYSCPVNDLCNGDCYKLGWQGDICAAPKKLMTFLKSQDSRSDCKSLLI